MHLGLDDALPALVRARYTAAKAAQALIFSDTELHIIRSRSGILFQLRYCPALSKKPTGNDDEPKSKSKPKSNGGKKFDPFENPSADLLISEVPRSNPTHILVLNKYPVIPEHFILTTKLNKAQTHLLEPDDLAATHACLRAWEDASHGQAGKLFAFFNSGAHSGASQAHRHLQFLPVQSMKHDQSADAEWEPLIERMLAPSDLDSGLDKTPVDGEVKTLRALKVANFACSLPTDPSVESLVRTYRTLYDAAAAAVRTYIDGAPEGGLELHPSKGGASPISYNLAMTMSGMAIMPRRKEGLILRDEAGDEVGEVALNGTVLAGTLMVKSAREWELLKRDTSQLDKVLEAIGVPLIETHMA